MKRLLSAGLAAMLLAASSASLAQVSDAVAMSVMQEIGLWKQLEGIGTQMSTSMVASFASDAHTASEPLEAERIARKAEDAFAAERLRDTSKRVLSEGLSAGDLPALRAWYRSPLGLVITKLEETAALDPREPEVVMREDAALLASLPATRRALIAELSIVTRAAEATTDTTIETSVAIETSAAAARPDMPHRAEREIRRALNAQRATMLQLNEKGAQGMFARTYQSISDTDFAKYIAFARTPAGRRCNDLTTRALNAAMVEAANQFGHGLLPASDGART